MVRCGALLAFVPEWLGRSSTVLLTDAVKVASLVSGGRDRGSVGVPVSAVANMRRTLCPRYDKGAAPRRVLASGSDGRTCCGASGREQRAAVWPADAHGGSVNRCTGVDETCSTHRWCGGATCRPSMPVSPPSDTRLSRQNLPFSIHPQWKPTTTSNSSTRTTRPALAQHMATCPAVPRAPPNGGALDLHRLRRGQAVTSTAIRVPVTIAGPCGTTTA